MERLILLLPGLTHSKMVFDFIEHGLNFPASGIKLDEPLLRQCQISADNQRPIFLIIITCSTRQLRVVL